MNTVPVLGVETVQVYENSSVVPDEMLAHRLGLLAVKTKGALGKSEGVKFSLQKQGPGIVTSGDIECVTANAEIAHKNIPILELGKNQSIRLEIEAEMGTGKTHVKWQPGIVSYKQLPKISFQNVKDPDAIAKVCPMNVLEVKAKKVFLADAVNCTVCGECRDRFPNETTIEMDDKSFVLLVESNGGVPAGEILEKALLAIKNKNEEFGEAVKAL